MSSAISVSELNTQIKGLLETTFSSVYVQGEISNLTYQDCMIEQILVQVLLILVLHTFDH